MFYCNLFLLGGGYYRKIAVTLPSTVCYFFYYYVNFSPFAFLMVFCNLHWFTRAVNQTLVERCGDETFNCLFQNNF